MVSRTSSRPQPSGPTRYQSPPPGVTTPRMRSPVTSPPATGRIRRRPNGPSPMASAASSRAVKVNSWTSSMPELDAAVLRGAVLAELGELEVVVEARLLPRGAEVIDVAAHDRGRRVGVA